MFIVELQSADGKVCEPYFTLAEAQRRVAQFPLGSLTTLPLIFEQLPDGSERLVRDDGKPLQWHRPDEDRVAAPDSPLPLHEALPNTTVEHVSPPDDMREIEDM